VLVAHAAERQLTKSQAGAVATAINLRHADLPSLKLGPSLTPAQLAQAHQLSAAVARCYGGPPYSEVLADVASPLFKEGSGGGATLIESETEIFPSAALAADDLAASGRPKGLACILSAYRALIGVGTPSGLLVRGQVSAIAPVVAGTGVTFATRLTFTTQASGSFTTAATIISRVDLFAFVRGQAEGSLVVQTAGAVPSASTERRLVELLVARERTAIG